MRRTPHTSRPELKFEDPFQPSPPAARALELGWVTRTDLLRLKAIARLRARGLPSWVTWIDLLQEAFARVLEDKRRPPPDVPMVAFIAEVMRSLRSEHLRRSQLESLHQQQAQGAVPQPSHGPEDQLAAAQALLRLHALFADDPQALQVVGALGEGFTAEEIRARHGITATGYDTIRKRIRRTLLREGLRFLTP
jgi:RNA polymerase sigma-70 factor (ECF subfamily)